MLPTPPHRTLPHLLTSLHTSSHLRIPTHISSHLLISPHTSLQTMVASMAFRDTERKFYSKFVSGALQPGGIGPRVPSSPSLTNLDMLGNRMAAIQRMARGLTWDERRSRWVRGVDGGAGDAAGGGGGGAAGGGGGMKSSISMPAL